MKNIVIIGGGFAGIRAAKELAEQDVCVHLIDRKNHHTFQPLLYQVATGTLSAAEIAQPIRGILSRQRNLNTILDEVVDIDTTRKVVSLKDQHNGLKELPYDYLILATGATHSYFGHPEWEEFAPGLKTIEDALRIRRHTLLALEEAERNLLLEHESKPVNFVVIGGGPTGVELAGALADTCRVYLKREFRRIDTGKVRIILLEAAPKLLGPYPDDLSRSACEQLAQCGVEVMLDTQVTDLNANSVTTNKGQIDASLIVWAAGVKASPLGKALNCELDRRGSVIVDRFLNPPGMPDVFVCGDLAHFEQDGKLVPGVAPTAMQMGEYAGKTICADLSKSTRKPFRYFDKGDMATIGRTHAVANVRWPFKAKFTGFAAWLSWLLIHVYFINGLRNRLLVFCQWVWTFFARQRAALLITDMQCIESKPVEAQQAAIAHR